MAWTAISTRNETPPIARGGWLDALRFIVASLIILHHFQAAGPHPLAELIHPVFERGGFLLTNFFLIDSRLCADAGLWLGRRGRGGCGRATSSPSGSCGSIRPI